MVVVGKAGLPLQSDEEDELDLEDKPHQHADQLWDVLQKPLPEMLEAVKMLRNVKFACARVIFPPRSLLAGRVRSLSRLRMGHAGRRKAANPHRFFSLG